MNSKDRPLLILLELFRANLILKKIIFEQKNHIAYKMPSLNLKMVFYSWKNNFEFERPPTFDTSVHWLCSLGPYTLVFYGRSLSYTAHLKSSCRLVSPSKTYIFFNPSTFVHFRPCGWWKVHAPDSCQDKLRGTKVLNALV